MSTKWEFPPVPTDLKALSPYFQRAQELRTKDVVMAYWCTYYAAKQGISSKAQSKDARPFLYQVMTILEEMKENLGGNDAVSDDDAGAAYIENFAMRVFTMADNEDRKGEATRSTAKKFLASANFLELLNIFEKPMDADITEKIRYSKWKAADLAKAFREGRKPAPGDAPRHTGVATLEPPPTQDSMSAWSPGTSVVPSPARGEDADAPLPQSTDVPPPPLNTPPPPSRGAFEGHLNLQQDDGYATPSGMWSTVATPGTEDAFRAEDVNMVEVESPSVRARRRLNGEDGDVGDDGWSMVANQALSRQGSWSQAQHEGEGTLGLYPTAPASVTASGAVTAPGPVTFPGPAASPPAPTAAHAPSLPKRVHFSPSVVGGLSSVSSSIAAASPPNSPVFEPTLPPVLEYVQSVESGPATLPLVERVPSPNGIVPPPPTPVLLPPPHHSAPAVSLQHSIPAAPSLSFVSPPQVNEAPDRYREGSTRLPISAPAPPMVSSSHAQPPPTFRGLPSAPLHRAAPPSSSPPELSPMQITKIQKHCKFAISALDYEDVYTARNELLAALAMLGG